MRRFWTLALAACAVLSFAAVWLGGINQDEGWYLYAANLVAEGKMPYRDFFYTQGPLMPIVYSAFAWIWGAWGLLGARIFTLALGLAGVAMAAATAKRLAPEGRGGAAAAAAFLLLGCNLYHIYYVAMPKTYALAGLFVCTAFYLLSFLAGESPRRAWTFAAGAGVLLAFAAGTRISLGAMLPVVGVWLLASRRWRALVWFCAGAGIGLALVYGPFLADPKAFAGLVAAQGYHAARGGSDVVWTVGSLSRLVRWYLPVFVMLGLGWSYARAVPADARVRRGFAGAMFASAAVVFAVQMLAPFPYEDYQVPVMGLVAAYAAAYAVRFDKGVLLALGMAFACSFGSPLLEKWSTNGQDRFWSIKKQKYELAQLRDVAAEIEALDPGGRDILTQDLYLAIETRRRVPAGLEMGPFSMLDDASWRKLLESAPCAVAALSGYTFAVDPPVCSERPVDVQMQYWEILKKRYELVRSENYFGQNSTPLLLLRRK